MPKLRVLVGTSEDTLKPIAVNKDKTPTEISSDYFKGRIAIRIKDYKGEQVPVATSGMMMLTWYL